VVQSPNPIVYGFAGTPSCNGQTANAMPFTPNYNPSCPAYYATTTASSSSSSTHSSSSASSSVSSSFQFVFSVIFAFAAFLVLF